MSARHTAMGLHPWVLAMFGLASTSIVYVAVSQFDLHDPATSDSSVYTAITRGASPFGAGRPFRYQYRGLVPVLLRVAPHTTDQQVQAAYGALDLVCLVCSWP